MASCGAEVTRHGPVPSSRGYKNKGYSAGIEGSDTGFRYYRFTHIEITGNFLDFIMHIEYRFDFTL